MPLQAIDLLIHARWVIPVEPANLVLENHAVAVHKGRVVAVEPSATARQKYAPAQTVELGEHALIPGLVNAHTHAAMTLMRGLADDLPLMEWLEGHIWPAEAKHVSRAFVRDGTQLACAEMLRGGVTTMNEMYFFPEAAVEAVQASGMRAVIGMIAIEFPTAYASDADDYLSKGLSVKDKLRGEPLISFALAPHAPYTVSDGTFSRIRALSDELGVPIHVHMHETAFEVEESLRQYGMRPLERLHKLGLLGPQFIGVHSVHLTEADIALYARNGASVAHCPTSNLKLASGIAPVAKLAAAGVNLAIGTDGAASNNRLDMFAEMRLAALLAKGASGDAKALPAHAALCAATLGGAKALGLEREIGSIVLGKAADLTAVRFDRIEMQPVYDPISHLVYVAERGDVSDVWVAGRALLREGAPAAGRGAKWLAVIDPVTGIDEPHRDAADAESAGVAKMQQPLSAVASTPFADHHTISALWQNRLKG